MPGPTCPTVEQVAEKIAVPRAIGRRFTDSLTASPQICQWPKQFPVKLTVPATPKSSWCEVRPVWSDWLRTHVSAWPPLGPTPTQQHEPVSALRVRGLATLPGLRLHRRLGAAQRDRSTVGAGPPTRRGLGAMRSVPVRPGPRPGPGSTSTASRTAVAADRANVQRTVPLRRGRTALVEETPAAIVRSAGKETGN